MHLIPLVDHASFILCGNNKVRCDVNIHLGILSFSHHIYIIAQIYVITMRSKQFILHGSFFFALNTKRFSSRTFIVYGLFRSSGLLQRSRRGAPWHFHIFKFCPSIVKQNTYCVEYQQSVSQFIFHISLNQFITSSFVHELNLNLPFIVHFDDKFIFQCSSVH